ncbi:MAG TPA: hypothetical protein VK797_26795 [Tepidisphaeraceae bacterium]|jgi:hypothetical protein|nr:hypothetical protein [Tepidisphaeraceae bacterium]
MGIEEHPRNERPTLDYAMPHSRAQPPRRIAAWVSSGLLLGIVLTPPALFLAVISAGAGHGDYAFARAFFPLPMLATRLTGNYISIPLIVAAILQLQLYGSMVGYALARHRKIVIAAVAFVHAAAVAGCFSGLIPNFS